MATLTNKQLKDSYQGLLTIKTADDTNPLSGRLENGLGNAITNLGIGTDAPIRPLSIEHPTSSQISFEDDYTGSPWLFGVAGDNSGKGIIYSASNIDFQIYTNNNPRLTVDGSGNVGIGTASPVNDVSGLHIAVASSSDQLYLERTGSATSRYYLGAVSNSFLIVDDAQSAERMRIDSSGNVGIGTAPDSILHAKGASATLTIENTTAGSSGSPNYSGIFFIQSDGTSTGASIQSGDQLNSNSNNNLIFTTRASGGGGHTEKLRILGEGGITFNGDTAQANALDDYEEGTWTPAFTTSGTDFTSVTYDTAFTGGKYTKIGDLVHIQGAIMTDAITVGSASGSIQISGLPFATSVSINGRDGFISLSIGVAVDFAGDHPVTIYSGDNTSVIQLMTRNTANGATVNLEVADLDTGVNKNIIYFAGTYKS